MITAGVIFAGLGVYRYLNQPLGYEYSDRARVSVLVPGKRLSGIDAVAALEAVRSLPGVRAAGLETSRVTNQPISLLGRGVDTSGVSAQAIGPGLFEAWGMKIQSGRWFETTDFRSQDAVVVDERFARSVWPGGAVGQPLQIGQTSRTVIGVVSPQRWRLDAEPMPTVFLPAPEESGRSPIIVWAPGVNVGELRTRISAAIATKIPGARVTVAPTSFESLFARSVGEAYFQIPFVIVFGVLATVLALVGVFGIVMFIVQQRTREFAIRLALGAGRLDVVGTVLRTSVMPALAGLTIGLVGAWTLASVIQATVFGWEASGAQTFVLVAVAILSVAVIAALAPAVRATRTDPAASLRLD